MANKILYLTPGCFDKGGISRYSRYQIEALREIFSPDSVRVLSLMGPGVDCFETPFDVAWHGPTRDATGYSRMMFSINAMRQMLLWRPDFIHCAHINLTPLVRLLNIMGGGEMILNVYGAEIWSGLTPSRSAGMARMTHVIADCHATADHVRDESLHCDPPTVIWDCADLVRFQPGAVEKDTLRRYNLPRQADKRILLTLGRLNVNARFKGYDRLLDVFTQVRVRVPTAHLVIAGRGDDAERLKDKANSLGLNESVTFTGPIDEEDLSDLYRAAHVFALVSDKGPDRGEGIPLTPIEAMACGLPVVVGDEDGSREAVDGNRNGIVVSPRDPSALIDALVTLLSETGTERQRRTKEARRVAEERFGYPGFVEKHREFYQAIAAEKHHQA